MEIKRLIAQMQNLLESLSDNGQLFWEQANSRKVQRECVWALSDEIYEQILKGYRIVTSLAAKQDFNISHYENELEQLILF